MEANDSLENVQVVVVIPAFKCKSHITKVIESLPPLVNRTIVVDDMCPEQTGRYVEEKFPSKVEVIYNRENLGVGGAVIAGYRQALKTPVDYVVKIDGDGQMDPYLIPELLRFQINSKADYVKGNRFGSLYSFSEMPVVRIAGNLALGILSKFSSGYYSISDPTNGFTSISEETLTKLPFEKINNRWFFESDMLFWLSTLKAKVRDFPMEAKYGEEKSNLRILKVVPIFAHKHLSNFRRRIFLKYFLRDFNAASLELVLGIISATGALGLGISTWRKSRITGVPSPAGTVTLVAMMFIFSTILILQFIAHDITSEPGRNEN